jgi:hypothetical protein
MADIGRKHRHQLGWHLGNLRPMPPNSKNFIKEREKNIQEEGGLGQNPQKPNKQKTENKLLQTNKNL